MTHPLISKAELEYWEKEIGNTEMDARSPTAWRKIFTSIPVWALRSLPAVFFLCACVIILTGYIGCNRVLAVKLIAFEEISFAVVVTSQLDLAPLHDGKIMGLTSFMARMAAVAVPHVVGTLTCHRSTHAEW